MRYLIFTLITLLFLNCKNDENVTYAEASAITIDAMEAPAKNYEKASKSVDLEMPSKPDLKIIKTANLRFPTSDINSTYTTIQNQVKQYQAIIQQDNAGKNDYSVYRNIKIRIPNQHFDSFITNLSKGVSHFDQKEISQEDVTEEYIDTEARVHSKKKLEERYLQLLSKANKVSEMLEIEKQLAEIREEIEAKEGQLKYMQNRVDMSTINIEMYTENAAESGATISFGSKIWNSVVTGFNAISNFMLVLISFWPIILIFVGMIIYIKKRFYKKTE